VADESQSNYRLYRNFKCYPILLEYIDSLQEISCEVWEYRDGVKYSRIQILATTIIWAADKMQTKSLLELKKEILKHFRCDLSDIELVEHKLKLYL